MAESSHVYEFPMRPHHRVLMMSGWTRVVVGPLRGMTFRETSTEMRVWAHTAADQAEADRLLRAQGFILINPPRGCQRTES